MILKKKFECDVESNVINGEEIFIVHVVNKFIHTQMDIMFIIKIIV